ncbi:hypothetical protein [Aeromicrobium sp. Sec7.5]|uniref:hypothetical protein n=1 Tax=Aeromicrobium sp. Sec7.5 TaxID=3121276 RepID=UPI002FE4F268
MNPIRRWSAVVVIGLALFVSSACGSDGVTIPTSDGDVTIDQDEGQVSLDDGEGNSFSTSAELPDGFPEDDVPIVEGTIVQGVAVDQDGSAGFSVTLEVDGSVAEVYDEAKGLLEDAGFTSSLDSSGQGFATAGYDDGTWTVLVNVGEIGDTSSVSYTVAKSGQF